MSLCALISSLVLGASAFNDTFDRGVSAYENKDYVGAIEAFELLVSEQVVDPAVFHNLGNAYYRSGRLGPAIANYERALQVHPGYENAAENLEQCVRQTEHRLPRPMPSEWEQSLLFWHYRLRPATTRALAVVSWLAFWLILGVRQVRRIPYLGVCAIALGVLAVAFGGSAWAKAHPDSIAVAGVEKTSVYYGKDQTSTVRFELYEGDRVLVDQREDGWVRVGTVKGDRGWAREEAFAFVGPPYERFFLATDDVSVSNGAGS